jgi:beta-lactamase superfamily II metal-dependent hydrolase
MGEKLLVRIYKVGCGDCIFVRVPDTDRPYHLLIDCGNFFGDKSAELRQAMNDVEALLNDEAVVPEDRLGHLDLVVATHQHWDHIKGFEAALETFKRIKIDRIWMPVAMKEDHPHALQLHALQGHVDKTIERLAGEPGLRLHPGLHSLLMMMSLSTRRATEVLRDDLPSHHGIQPLYVYRGFEEDLSAEERKEYLPDFKDPRTKLLVLAPEKEVDGAYMGSAFALLEDLDAGEHHIDDLIPGSERISWPTNISRREFRQLQTSLRYTSLLAASQANHVVNNTSVVLLLEWNDKRLLFPGDAERESWRLMWQNMEPELSDPVHLLKVSHHGSHNGTPYDLCDPDHEINCILDAILPTANAGMAQAVVSTLAGRIHAVANPVPHPALMKELADRVNNTHEYPPALGKQPQRTDKEEDEDWIDVKIEPTPD